MIRGVITAIASAPALVWVTACPPDTIYTALRMEASGLITEDVCSTSRVRSPEADWAADQPLSCVFLRE